MTLAVIVVDVQYDFCEGGSLAVAGGTQVARAVSARLREGGYDFAVATRDRHVDPGAHFSAHPDLVDSWPAHCVIGSTGADLHADLDTARVCAIFDKGAYEAAYSGFQGECDGIGLAVWLRENGVDAVEVTGIATDYCVRATALDARREGLATTVRLDLTAGVAATTVRDTLLELRAAGVTLIGRPIASA